MTGRTRTSPRGEPAWCVFSPSPFLRLPLHRLSSRFSLGWRAGGSSTSENKNKTKHSPPLAPLLSLPPPPTTQKKPKGLVRLRHARQGSVALLVRGRPLDREHVLQGGPALWLRPVLRGALRRPRRALEGPLHHGPQPGLRDRPDHGLVPRVRRGPPRHAGADVPQARADGGREGQHRVPPRRVRAAEKGEKEKI